MRPISGRPLLRAIIVAEMLIVVVSSLSFLVIANLLSGPFSTKTWFEMGIIWLVAPIIFTILVSTFGVRLFNQGKKTLGYSLVVAPIMLLVLRWLVG